MSWFDKHRRNSTGQSRLSASRYASDLIPIPHCHDRPITEIKSKPQAVNHRRPLAYLSVSIAYIDDRPKAHVHGVSYKDLQNLNNFFHFSVKNSK